MTYIALDWHQLDTELGSEKLVEAFWSTLSAVAPRQVRLVQPYVRCTPARLAAACVPATT